MLTDKLIWLDMEMTGLDPNHDQVLEIATIVTNRSLEEWVEGPNLVIHQPKHVLDAMDDWNQRHHGASGLIDAVLESTCSVSEAEAMTLTFLRQHVKEGASPLCGNSVCQDKQFLMKHMPSLAHFFHYRLLDVSSLKMAWRFWRPEYPVFDKGNIAHRALDDIKMSIRECQHYQRHLLESN